MGKDDKLSLILMRDDAPVRQYQFRTMWGKLFLYVQIVPVVAALLGLSGGLLFRNMLQEEADSHLALLQQTYEQHGHYERIRHVQEILDNADHDFHDLFTDFSHSPVPLPSIGNPPVDLIRLFAHVDSRLLSVENMQAQIIAEKLRLRFEIHNLSDAPFTGMMSVDLVGQDASVVQTHGEEDELRFAIERFHEVNVLLGLPIGTSLKDCFALRLTLSDSDKENVFIQTMLISDVIDARI